MLLYISCSQVRVRIIKGLYKHSLGPVSDLIIILFVEMGTLAITPKAAECLFHKAVEPISADSLQSTA